MSMNFFTSAVNLSLDVLIFVLPLRGLYVKRRVRRTASRNIALSLRIGSDAGLGIRNGTLSTCVLDRQVEEHSPLQWGGRLHLCRVHGSSLGSDREQCLYYLWYGDGSRMNGMAISGIDNFQRPFHSSYPW
jgi:hypothetical protein